MPLGLLIFLGVGLYLHHQRTKAAAAQPLSDPAAIAAGWGLLAAWSQSQSGRSAGAQPASISDPRFLSLTQQFQTWASARGYVYKTRSATGPLPTDGVLDAPTFAVLSAVVDSSAWSGPETFTTGGYYYLSFVKGAAGLDRWALSSEVDAAPIPDGIIGPAAWLAQLADGNGQAIAIGCWLGPQYGTDDRVTSFGPVPRPPVSPTSWSEISGNLPKQAEAGTYRISFDTLGTSKDAATAATAKKSGDVGFDLMSDPPAPSKGGPWPMDDVGSDMPSGTPRAGMPAASPLPRVRMQWSVSKDSPWPIPDAASRVRVWAQDSPADVVSYKGVAITVSDDGSRADAGKRWLALYAGDGGAISRLLGPSRHAVLSKAQAAIDETLHGVDARRAGAFD